MAKVADCNEKLQHLVNYHNKFVYEINSTIKSGGNLGSRAEITKIYETWFNDELMEHFRDQFIPLCDCDCGEQSWSPNEGVVPWDIYSSSWNPSKTTDVLMREIYLPGNQKTWTCQTSCQTLAYDHEYGDVEEWEENKIEMEKLGYFRAEEGHDLSSSDCICTTKAKGTGRTFPPDTNFRISVIEFSPKRKHSGSSSKKKKKKKDDDRKISSSEFLEKHSDTTVGEMLKEGDSQHLKKLYGELEEMEEISSSSSDE